MPRAGDHAMEAPLRRGLYYFIPLRGMDSWYGFVNLYEEG